MAILTNVMTTSAQYNNGTVNAQSTVTVEMGSMNLVKTADKDPWIDGELTYTIVLTNIEDPDLNLPLTNIVFTDTIDPLLTTLNTENVTINGNLAVLGTDYQYDAGSGLLTISYNEEVLPRETVEIIFRVKKV